VAGTLATHADDLASVVAAVAQGVGEEGDAPTRPPPVVCAHSFGGLILEELVSRSGASSASSAPVPISGAAYLGSVPPSGNKAMVGRFLKRDPWASAKLTYAFIAASFAKDAKTCRECFLSAQAPDSLVEAVRSKIAANLSPLRLIDLTDMNKRVPLPPPSAQAATPAPALVLRGVEDGVVDAEAAEELAAWCGGGKSKTTRVEIEGLAHDVMLDVRWEEAARELVAWLEKI
jgi:alpha-beta hydrolase superfamily lysophospholipase